MGDRTNNTMDAEKSKKNTLVFLILIISALAAGSLAYLWFFEWRFNLYTNDAYVEGDIATISPKVNGYVENILVEANSQVKKGSPLFKLDDRDYKINLKHAIVELEGQNKALNTIDAQVKAAKATLMGMQAQLPAAQANLETSYHELDRVQKLNIGKFATNSQLEATSLKLKQAKANIASVNSKIENAQSNIEVLIAKRSEIQNQIKALHVMREKAEHDLNDTLIKAPFDGVLSNLVAKKGDLVSAGQRLASLVPTNQLYVVANYKETQVTDIEPGIVADITVDALDKKSFAGRVVSIAPATGSMFSIMPPQNATGNFTKVVQRIPVRIALPHDILESGLLRAGMSVGVNIDTRNKLE